MEHKPSNQYIMENLITIAVKENKPELITNHPDFDISKLKEYGCGIAKALIDEHCYTLSCDKCPFGSLNYNGEENTNQTLESMLNWLNVKQTI